MQLNTLAMVHAFLKEHVRPGALCIDTTAGRGRDTALLCRLAADEEEHARMLQNLCGC